VSQLDDNLAALDNPSLSDDELAQIGPGINLWAGSSDS
jgi:hypothetical protein